MLSMQRAIAAAVILAVIGIPFAAGTDGVCARMPCCAKETVQATVGAPTCCTVENCAVAPRQNASNVPDTRSTTVVTLAAVTMPAILSHGIIGLDHLAGPPIGFSPPAARRLALLSILLI
jgi:hypothetical protein